MLTVDLLPHPAAPALALSARVEVLAVPAGLTLTYRVLAPGARLRLPAAAGYGAADGLWQHTCAEAFLAAVDDPAYREFNFSPSGQWAAYAFAGYRERTDAAPAAAPRIDCRPEVDGFALTARLVLPMAGRWRLGLSLVLESEDGLKAYWALAHPAAQPDFHHPDSFLLPLNLN